MIVVCVLNGWSASSQYEETKTATLVERLTREHERLFLARRSALLRTRTRLYRRFIRRYDNRENELLLVGKSLGARNIVEGVLNRLKPLEYRRTALVTIDPNWPTFSDLKPNLNRQLLHLEHAVGMAINIFAVLPENQQAGSLLSGPNVENIPVSDYDHQTITLSREVEEGIRKALRFLAD
jgi:hypothetical protein